MNWEGFGRKRSFPDIDISPVFSWGSIGNPGKPKSA
jgi:hypothetical protein